MKASKHFRKMFAHWLKYLHYHERYSVTEFLIGVTIKCWAFFEQLWYKKQGILQAVCHDRTYQRMKLFTMNAILPDCIPYKPDILFLYSERIQCRYTTWFSWIISC